jgi:hypothetical protein
MIELRPIRIHSTRLGVPDGPGQSGNGPPVTWFAVRDFRSGFVHRGCGELASLRADHALHVWCQACRPDPNQTSQVAEAASSPCQLVRTQKKDCAQPDYVDLSD